MSEFDARFPKIGSSSAVLTPLEPVPGKTTLTGGALPRTTRELPSHAQPKSAFRTPADEKPSDWNAFVKIGLPIDPFSVQNLIPPPTCPMPKDAVMERAAGHHSESRVGGDPPVIITPFKANWRQECWYEYMRAAQYVQTMQEQAAPDILRYQHAEQDDQLAALGFLMTKGFKGDLNTLASRQELPHRGGLQLTTLFNPDNSLALTPRDRDGMATVAKDGVADAAFLIRDAADADLRAALKEVSGAAAGMQASRNNLAHAQEAIILADAQQEASASIEGIAQLKASTETLGTVLDFLDDAPNKIIKMANEGITRLSHVGSASALILRLFPVAGMEALEKRLASAQRTIANSLTSMLERDLEEAKATSQATMFRFGAATERLKSAMSKRRLAYNDAGRQAGEAAGGNNKIAAIVSAVPVVETVVVALENLVAKTKNARPPYNDAAGIGYGIARAHQVEAAYLLPDVIGAHEFCNTQLDMVRIDWVQRLQALKDANEQMAGSRPEGDVALPPDKDFS